MKYKNIEEAVSRINRNGGMAVHRRDSAGKVIEKSIRHKFPGIKILGAIDFLVNHHGFLWKRS